MAFLAVSTPQDNSQKRGGRRHEKSGRPSQKQRTSISSSNGSDTASGSSDSESEEEQTTTMPRKSPTQQGNAHAVNAAAVMNNARTHDENASPEHIHMHTMNQHATADYKQEGEEWELMCRKIKEAVELNWGGCKFVRGAESEKNLVRKVLKVIDPTNFSDADDATQQQKENFEKFFEIYGQQCTKELNKLRNYVITRIKMACAAYKDDSSNKKWPDMKMIEKCAKREIDQDNPDEMDFWFWYVEKLVPACCAQNADWSEDHRHFDLLSTSAPPNAPNRKHVPKSSEAFICTACEGYMEAWKALEEVKLQHKKKKLTPRLKDEKGQVVTEKTVSTVIFLSVNALACIPLPTIMLTFPLFFHCMQQVVVGDADNANGFNDPTRVHLLGTAFKGKYAESTGGKQRCDGWKDIGVQAWKKHMKWVKDGRAKPVSQDLEEMAKEEMRKNHGITAATLEEHLNMKKRKQADDNETEADAAGLIDSDFEDY